ncbi:uncharacterized protein BXZ73DRAFT_87435 [Epithele typhae]|uniref:uncharacterized protein n=1 Tax=Epithele typhae TaxID=378194 RepID=UPI0020089907|nr:uncharacterized protein BXZ73DRAFT_87435 [Epithele typhae]KAH9942986.1 hypothetical protein BXZ73DRAFT_87435 [Epithele typhae]
MEYTTNAAAWPSFDLPTVHDERSSTAPDDWKEQAASGLNELLGDLQAQNASSTSSNPSAPIFFSLPQSFITTAPPTFSNFNNTQWPQASQLPLSSYSSLNGANPTPSTSQLQSQSSSSMGVIDPSLTTMHASSASPPPQYTPGPFLSSPSSQPRMAYHYQQQSHPQPLSVGPSFMPPQFSQPQQHHLAFPRHHSHSPPQPQPQGTLSPFALHTPSSSLYSSIPTSSFYGQPTHPQAGPSSSTQTPIQPAQAPPQPVAPTPPVNKISEEQRRANLARDIKPLIQPTSFTGAGAVTQLVKLLDEYGIADVDPSVRLETLTKIRDNAGNHYFRAWVDNAVAIDVTREWLKLAFVGRSDAQLVETIMPILHIIDRLPFTIDKLKLSKLGKLIIKLVKEPPTPAIKDMASNLERKWRKMLTQGASDKMDTENPEDTKSKKRRAELAVPKGAPPVKKAAVVGSATATTPKVVAAKKDSKSVVKDAKSDSSFFSKPKPVKKEMPSFKKNPPTATAVKKEADANMAQPSSFNPFEDILKTYASNAGTGSTSTPPPAGALQTPKKSVRWAADDKLERVKFIERAGSHPTHNIRDLERDEGAALHQHIFDEQMEWAEPQPLDIPREFEVEARGSKSQECAAQEERELSALVVLYTSPAQIPDSPAEPSSQLSEEQTDEGVCLMTTGHDADGIFWDGGEPALVDTIRPTASVAELVGQLQTDRPDVVMSDPSAAASAMPSVYPALNEINSDQLQLLMAHAAALSQNGSLANLGGRTPPSEPSWAPGNQFPEYDRGTPENGSAGSGPADPNRRWTDDWPGPGAGAGGGGPERGGPFGRGGRGLGGGRGRGAGRGQGEGRRNTKRRPCTFFMAGRCRYGDQCDFSHELAY